MTNFNNIFVSTKTDLLIDHNTLKIRLNSLFRSFLLNSLPLLGPFHFNHNLILLNLQQLVRHCHSQLVLPIILIFILIFILAFIFIQIQIHIKTYQSSLIIKMNETWQALSSVVANRNCLRWAYSLWQLNLNVL